MTRTQIYILETRRANLCRAATQTESDAYIEQERNLQQQMRQGSELLHLFPVGCTTIRRVEFGP